MDKFLLHNMNLHSVEQRLASYQDAKNVLNLLEEEYGKADGPLLMAQLADIAEECGDPIYWQLRLVAWRLPHAIPRRSREHTQYLRLFRLPNMFGPYHIHSYDVLRSWERALDGYAHALRVSVSYPHEPAYVTRNYGLGASAVQLLCNVAHVLWCAGVVADPRMRGKV